MEKRERFGAGRNNEYFCKVTVQNKNMRYMIVAGEASGDLHGSQLITSLKRYDGEPEFRFFGGDRMAEAAGTEPDLHYESLNVMGFSEVLRSLPRILRNLGKARQLMRSWRPDVLVLIDFPGFNLKLAKAAKGMGIPVHYFISPKIWAWKEYRIRSIRRYVDSMYCILPFEQDYYQRRHRYAAVYVGNPSVKEIDAILRRVPAENHFRERFDITDPRPVIALLPGSRRGELRNNLPLMIEAARRFPAYQYIVAAAPAQPERLYREIAQDPGLKVVFGATHALLRHSRAALVTSGTATLETALAGTPQVVCYRANGSPLSYAIMERLLKVKYVSLPNLIADREVVPELLVHRCTADTISDHLAPLLAGSPERDRMLAGYRLVRRRLGDNDAADRAAEMIADALRNNSPTA